MKVFDFGNYVELGNKLHEVIERGMITHRTASFKSMRDIMQFWPPALFDPWTVSEWDDSLQTGDLFYFTKMPDRTCVFLGYSEDDIFSSFSGGKPLKIIECFCDGAHRRVGYFSSVEENTIVIVQRANELSD